MALLNLGEAGFVDVSGVSGFAHDDDARALAVVDWNHDGRLDVLLKNRTGPQLRYLENRTPAVGRGFVELRLTGTSVNRDAIGAIVELTAKGRTRLQHVRAGSGYLAQSSSTVHFGLDDATSIDALVVHWPGGEAETIQPPAINGLYEIVEGSGRARALSYPATRLRAGSRERPTPPGTRLLLKTPLPLPPTFLRALGVEDSRPTLVNLWAHWCEPCAGEVVDFAGASDRLAARSIDWRLASLDAPGDREAATRWLSARFREANNPATPETVFLDEKALTVLEALVEHVTGQSGELPIPASLLLDGSGNLQMLYLGPVFSDRFLSDARVALDPSMRPARRSLHPGRWYYRSPRNFDGLRETLATAGADRAAAFYGALATQESR